jgi:hypothetical protein
MPIPSIPPSKNTLASVSRSCWERRRTFPTSSICFTGQLIVFYRKKDGVDIDNFVEYEKLMKKVLDEMPSKLIVYLELDDVKASAKVCCVLVCIFMVECLLPRPPSDVMKKILRVMMGALVKRVVM